MIHYHYTILTLICRLNRADLGAGRIVAVIAHQYYRFLGGFSADLVFDFHLPDPVDIPSLILVQGHVVFMPARVKASRAAGLALIEID
jgi:hypothetical protein